MTLFDISVKLSCIFYETLPHSLNYMSLCVYFFNSVQICDCYCKTFIAHWSLYMIQVFV